MIDVAHAVVIFLAQWVPIVFGIVVGVYGLRQPDNRVRLIALALLVSPFSTLLGLPFKLAEVDNWWISFAWPVLAALFLLMALVDHLGRFAFMLVSIAFITQVMTMVPVEARPYSLVSTRLVGVGIMLAALVVSEYKSNKLTAGLSLFYGLGCGLLFSLRTMQAPDGEAAFVAMRAAQTGGLWFLLSWFRTQPSLTPLGSSVLRFARPQRSLSGFEHKRRVIGSRS